MKMIYRLDIPVYNKADKCIKHESLYLESNGMDSPGGYTFVEVLESLAQIEGKWKEAIAVIKNLAAGTEHDWVEYFPWFRPSREGPNTFVQRVVHPKHPKLGEHELTLSAIKIHQPYWNMVFDTHASLSLLKNDELKEINKWLKRLKK